jgi:serine/threonine protein kinase
MLAPDTVLQNRYRIVRQLGQGGMGAVYEAIDQRLSRTVALKETLVDTEELRRAFEREARLLANLNHPSLPRVIDHFTEDEGQYLVMDFIPGDDLKTLLDKRGKPFDPDEVLKWADELLDALEYLHTHEPFIIHRDIKPANLKLTAKGKIVLLDFGLAKGAAGQMTVAGTLNRSVFGYSPNYAPLEQIQGERTLPRSDLYSLAATLYHLLTGQMPPDALTRATTIFNDEPDPLVPIEMVNPAVPSGLSSVIKQALSLNPKQRPASAAEMRKALLSQSDYSPAESGESSIDVTSLQQTVASPYQTQPPLKKLSPSMQQTMHAPIPLMKVESIKPVNSAAQGTGIKSIETGKDVLYRAIIGGIAAVLLLLILGVWIANRNSSWRVTNNANGLSPNNNINGQTATASPADSPNNNLGAERESTPDENQIFNEQIRRVNFRRVAYQTAARGLREHWGREYWGEGYTQRDIADFRATPVFGDISGDGNDEAAVSVHYNMGGSGSFTGVFIYTLRDSNTELIGRVIGGSSASGGIEGVEIENGHLVICSSEQNLQDEENRCHACYQFLDTKRYRLEGNRLIQVGRTQRRTHPRASGNFEGDIDCSLEN